MEGRRAMPPLPFCCTVLQKVSKFCFALVVVGHCWLHRVNHHPHYYCFRCVLIECMLLHCTHMGVTVQRSIQRTVQLFFNLRFNFFPSPKGKGNQNESHLVAPDTRKKEVLITYGNQNGRQQGVICAEV
jgi:hypothetical protein